MEALVAVTYRCNSRCHMCNTWQHQTHPDDEVTVTDLEKLPSGLRFANITGGEPFLRKDLNGIIEILQAKAKRVVISTNGFYTERIIETAKKFPDLGFRISLEGLPRTNDELRGMADCFDHGLRSLLQLKDLGIRDIGFGITASDKNARDIMDLYRLASALNVEFATAVVHNSFYFHIQDNEITRKDDLIEEFSHLIAAFFRTYRLKNWFRAYFNYGIINYIQGGKRLLPCEVGTDLFFVDPFARVLPCNAMDEPFGSLREQSWQEIWEGDRAKHIRSMVKNCDRHCWMIGSAAPAMKKNLLTPALWILRNRRKYLHRY